jgi:fructan beta-fructosidase
MQFLKYFLFFNLILFCQDSTAQNIDILNKEKYRPQIHFTPEKNWVNDPNGMVFYKGTYHLFFQHSPDATVWSNMSWGHATSKDLVHWDRKPIAIYPDSLGFIFSGSAVVDKNNTSGLGKNGIIPLVAMYTSHDMVKEKEGAIDVETQSLAYSLDEGKTWVKYANNPVLKNPGIRDFRDPKIIWHASSKKWIASIAAQDKISFYTSSNLLNWVKLSDFGKTEGAHGGVWECPDLFPIEFNNKTYWVLLVNLNPGGPNGGSATQYFVGEFDGKVFKSNSKLTKWADYGPDEYAGVTWSNTEKRRILIGWMSNWQYANVVPTEKFRNAFTLPRELGLAKIGDEFYLKSMPVKEIKSIEKVSINKHDISVNESIDLSNFIGKINVPSKFDFTFTNQNNYSIEFSNTLNEKVIIGYNNEKNSFFLDRRQSGRVDFEKDFARINFAPRLSNQKVINLTIYLDKSSFEIFADNGLSILTSVVFPNENYTSIKFLSSKNAVIKKFTYTPLRSIW